MVMFMNELLFIIRWIQQKGTSPLTREPLNIADLRSEYFAKQQCQLYQSNAVRYACQNNTAPIGSSPMTQFEIHTNQQKSCKQYCNIKRILLTIMTISLITIPLIIATILILFLVQSNLISENSAHTYNGQHSFCGGAVNLPNYLNQILDTKVGQLYRITFWLRNLGDTPNSTPVVISY
ncbi:unnamed protein product [Rotaria socialis]|uniref:Uncharacterized protein n=2 Tax=Rotaria socialis TaxID=392032 RepID=A0A818EK45_9BILA|nr:unnamed protein product [Rotaria socialis]